VDAKEDDINNWAGLRPPRGFLQKSFFKQSVILSEGEATNFLYPEKLPEPQSKNLTRRNNRYRWRQNIPKQKASLSQVR